MKKSCKTCKGTEIIRLYELSFDCKPYYARCPICNPYGKNIKWTTKKK